LILIHSRTAVPLACYWFASLTVADCGEAFQVKSRLPANTPHHQPFSPCAGRRKGARDAHPKPLALRIGRGAWGEG